VSQEILSSINTTGQIASTLVLLVAIGLVLWAALLAVILWTLALVEWTWTHLRPRPSDSPLTGTTGQGGPLIWSETTPQRHPGTIQVHR
jgi:hypothetical protein